MRNTENPRYPQTIIAAGNKKYQVNLSELTTFLETCDEKLGLCGHQMLANEFGYLTDFVIDGAHADQQAESLIARLKFLRELEWLFNELVREVN